MEIRGADDVDALVRNIRQHADAKAFRRELNRGINSISKEVRREMQAVIPDALPRRGGLADLVASRTTSRATVKGGRYAGVSMRFSSKGSDIRLVAGKRLRHPVFGNRNVIVEQTEGLRPDVFPETFQAAAPRVQSALVEVLNDIARKVAE